MHVAIGLRASLSAFHFGSRNFVRMRLWSPLFCHGCLLKPFYRRFLTMRSKNLRRRYNRNDSSYEANELAMHWTFGSYHALHCTVWLPQRHERWWQSPSCQVHACANWRKWRNLARISSHYQTAYFNSVTQLHLISLFLQFRLFLPSSKLPLGPK